MHATKSASSLGGMHQYSLKSKPIYLLPFTYNTLTTSNITNGYGFRQEQ